MELTFFGGAGGVTGSKYLLDVNGQRLLIDCGLFQGLSDIRERNRSLPFPPDTVDTMVLSHAHIDHSGMIPALVKRGYGGPIFMTPATRDVSLHMLNDVAQIEMQDAAYWTKHKVGAPADREPLFTTEDVQAAWEHFVEVPYARDAKEWRTIGKNIRLKFYDAGHVLGSAVTVLEVGDGKRQLRIGYSGDLGALGMPLLHDPEIPEEELDVFLLESTYGNRTHEPLSKSVDRLAQVINDVVKRHGKIVIPAFSLGRTQTIIYVLHKLTDEGKIPRLPVYVDSPLAGRLMDVYAKHVNDYDEETKTDFASHYHRPLSFKNLEHIESVGQSKELNIKPGPFIVISASGMMTAGRVVHHLRHTISDDRNAVLITGYQADGTLGRRLLEGASSVDLYGDTLPVRAQIEKFNEFSAHADREQLIDYMERCRFKGKLFLVHGEPTQAEQLKSCFQERHPDWSVERPNEGAVVEL